MAVDRDFKPLLDVRQNHLRFLISVSNNIDSKALALLATNVAVVLFVGKSGLDLHRLGYVACLCLYAVSVALCIATVWPRKYSGAAVDPDEHPEYLNMGKDELILHLLSDTMLAIKNNKALNESRLRLYLLAVAATGLATIGLLFILIV